MKETEVIETTQKAHSFHFHIEDRGNIIIQYNDVNYKRFIEKINEIQTDFIYNNLENSNKATEGFNYKFIMYKQY